MDENKARDLYIKMQIIQRHIEQLEEHMVEIDQKTLELRTMIDAVEESAGIKEGDELMVPLTSGIFMHAKASDTKKLLLNVGAQTNIPRSQEDTKEILLKQQEELSSYRDKIREQQLLLSKEAEKIEQSVMEAMKGNV